MHLYFGPLNKDTATKELEHITSLLLKEPTGLASLLKKDEYKLEKVIEKGEVVDIRLVGCDSRVQYSLGNILKNANFEHIKLDKKTKEAYHHYLNSSARHYRPCLSLDDRDNNKPHSHKLMLTDERIRHLILKEKISDDLKHLGFASLKAINLYTKDYVFAPINNMLSGSFARLRYHSNAEINELFLIAIVCMDALNTVNCKREAITYTVYRGESSEKFFKASEGKISFGYAQQKFISTSIDERSTEKFRYNHLADKEIIIKYPEVQGKEISSISHYPSEAEVLFIGRNGFFTKVHEDQKMINYIGVQDRSLTNGK